MVPVWCPRSHVVCLGEPSEHWVVALPRAEGNISHSTMLEMPVVEGDEGMARRGHVGSMGSLTSSEFASGHTPAAWLTVSKCLLCASAPEAAAVTSCCLIRYFKAREGI